MTTDSLLSLLVCPVDGFPLRVEQDQLVSAAGIRYPVINGIPVLLPPDASNDTLECIRAGRAAAAKGIDDPYCISALGCSDDERLGIEQLIASGSKIDPVVNYLVAATCGNLYKHMIGKLTDYPIPEFREAKGNGRVLVDLGCNWGRWCVAAARKEFNPIGVDHQLGALIAAKRVTEELGINAQFVCADARQLPFREHSVDFGFSYSVLQHLSHDDVAKVLKRLSKALKPGGEVLIQMPTKIGLKGWLHRARTGFRAPTGFNVRYWSLSELRQMFGRLIGPTAFSVDCFFGIGLQAADKRLMPAAFQAAILASEALRALSQVLPPVTWLADSVYVHSHKPS
ncbi:MAG: methyltransferase domain-containing protein [Verrucomicrobiaceae bacterium]